MRAADITINEEYVACTANPYSHKTWQDKRSSQAEQTTE